MKYCEKCGKELFDEAVLCPGCGCPVGTKKPAPQDYRVVLQSTQKVMVIGIVLLVLGVLAWLANYTLSLIYTVIAEEIQGNILGLRPTQSLYDTCDFLADWSGAVFLLAAEIVFAVPRGKFNSAFKLENYDLFIKNRPEYKRAAQTKDRELMGEIPYYAPCRTLTIVAFVLFMIAIIIPGPGL